MPQATAPNSTRFARTASGYLTESFIRLILEGMALMGILRLIGNIATNSAADLPGVS
jgi:hypothetical protein